MKTFALRSLVIVLCLALLLPAFGWWEEGHMLVNRAAALKLPQAMPSFFRKAVARLEYDGPEPDRWKASGVEALYRSEDPEHYLNLEMLNGFGDMPDNRYAYIKQLEAKRAADAAAGIKPPGAKEALTPDNVGTQPYAVIETYGRLVEAFREYRRLVTEKKSSLAAQQNAVLYAGWMGHYVADGAQPLHVTVHYNGWTGANPNGYTTDRHTHANFEGEFVKANLTKFPAKAIAAELKPPKQLQHPFADYLQYLRESNAQVEKLYQLEKAGAFKGAGTDEGVAFVRARFIVGSQMLLNLWYTAWLESATDPRANRPRPPAKPPV
jgi:hypothetical protein